MRRQAIDGTYELIDNNPPAPRLRAATRDPKPASVVVDKPLIQLMLTGQKTQIRVPGIQQYEAGRVYAVKPALGSPKRCDIEALEVWVQQLGDITWPQAKAEGYRTPAEFLNTWRQLYGKDTELQTTVTVLQIQIWSDAPRLLTPTAKPRGSDQGYTDDPNMAMNGTADPGEALRREDLLTLTEWRPALADARRREPLAVWADQLKADLDSFQAELARNTDRQIRQAVRSMQHQLNNIQSRLGSGR
jgi:hypothetical protein